MMVLIFVVNEYPLNGIISFSWNKENPSTICEIPSILVDYALFFCWVSVLYIIIHPENILHHQKHRNKPQPKALSLPSSIIIVSEFHKNENNSSKSIDT